MRENNKMNLNLKEDTILYKIFIKTKYCKCVLEAELQSCKTNCVASSYKMELSFFHSFFLAWIFIYLLGYN